MSRDLLTLAANLAETDTTELEQALARARKRCAGTGFFPDRRRADSRAYFAVVDELAARTRWAAAPTSRPPAPTDLCKEQP